MRAVVLSYLMDAVLLFGFALAGTIPMPIPLAYLAAGLADSGWFYLLSRRMPEGRSQWHTLTCPRMFISSAIQLTFIALVPQIGFYFVTVLFIVYGFGSMALSVWQSVATWSSVALVTAVLLANGAQAAWIPQANLTERLLVWLCFISVLGRCVLLGVFGRSLRERLQRRSRQLTESVGALKQRDQSLERVNAELQYQATHDALTGLANRVLFAEELEKAIAAQRPFAVCVLDLDRFKVINDSLGHGAGDALLKLVGRRLLSTTRTDDAIARAGGDEFLLLLQELGAREDVEKLAARWMSALSEPYRVHGTELHISPSIGIARYPIDSADGEELLARADEAMYQAKQAGRNMFRFFDADVMGSSRERLAIEADLRQAISQSQFQLHYQPKIDIASGMTRSVEALLRWQHPIRGRMMPGDFIAIAEDTGLILPIGDWVVREACHQARLWQQQGLPFLRVAVNVSPTQFRQSGFPNMVREALQAYALDPSYLEIELTEATLMSNAERSVTMLEQLSRLGVLVSIDDFGTGYSSMTYLQRFPIDKLKIDRSFIRDLDSNPDDASIVRAIISLAHGLRLKVVAEGVETSAQLDILRRMGCDQYQGYLRSPAVSASDIPALLAAPQISEASPAADQTFSKLARLVRSRPQ
ncbi:MAG TPA: EAL domain-containing protein [Steroidobacteraceae bacterium]|jgi:diguanylate cyclase (GGDEF)-like protein|nr:EAL domain-containing protein [Steroidobacteraceae bacterium]